MEELSEGVPGDLLEKIVKALNSVYKDKDKLRSFLRFKLNLKLSNDKSDIKEILV